MEKLIQKIESLRNSEISKTVIDRIKEFKQVNKESADELFEELYYCILTARSPAEKCIEIQNKIGDYFHNCSEEDITKKLKDMGYHFHNRAKYISKAAKDKEKIKEAVNSFRGEELREWIIGNIKGIGPKESSHFLRNVGFDDFAIIDYHIIDVLVKYKLIEKPKTMTRKKYLEIEKILKQIAQKSNLTLAELDLYLWYMETSKILK